MDVVAAVVIASNRLVIVYILNCYGDILKFRVHERLTRRSAAELVFAIIVPIRPSVDLLHSVDTVFELSGVGV